MILTTPRTHDRLTTALGGTATPFGIDGKDQTHRKIEAFIDLHAGLVAHAGLAHTCRIGSALVEMCEYAHRRDKITKAHLAALIDHIGDTLSG